jgi:hypothetical protein
VLKSPETRLYNRLQYPPDIPSWQRFGASLDVGDLTVAKANLVDCCSKVNLDYWRGDCIRGYR